MTLDEIKLQWEKDCEVDDIELDKSSLEVPKLHAKYSDMLSSKILLLKKYNQDYNELLKYKWLWYTGKLDDDQIKQLGWQTDPFDGLKIMKNDFNYFFNADNDLKTLKAKIEYYKTLPPAIKEKMRKADEESWQEVDTNTTK